MNAGTFAAMTQPAASPARSAASLVLLEMGKTPYEDLESYSPFCVKVNRALGRYGLAYERRETPRDELVRISPVGQWPVLLDGERPIADSTRIVEHLETIAATSLLPSDSRARGEAWLWEEFADTALNGFFVAARWADDDNWPRVKDAYFADAPAFVRALITPVIRRDVVKRLVGRDVWRAGPVACWARFAQTLDRLELRAPFEGFWLGDALTIADLAIFAQLHGLRNDLTPRQRDAIADRPALSRYLDRVHQATGVPTSDPRRAS